MQKTKSAHPCGAATSNNQFEGRLETGMNKLFAPLALGTNIYKGYDLAHALAGVRRLGFDTAEIASIIGNCIHVEPAEMTDEKAAEVKKMLIDNNLKTYAFAGHADLTDDKQYSDFLIKMQFAKKIGAKIINTNSGPIDRYDIFMTNLKEVIRLAEQLDIIVCLESHGDIVDTGKKAAELMGKINHPLIRLNYDTGNTYYYAKGKIDIAEDLKYGLPYLAHIHLKDIRLEGNRAIYTAIGEGDLDFGAIFATIRTLGGPVPCGFEIPVYVEGTLDALSPAKAPLSEREIDAAVRSSMKFVESLI